MAHIKRFELIHDAFQCFDLVVGGKLSVCSRFRLRFKLHSSGMWDRSSWSSSLSAQFSLSNLSLAVTSREVSLFCEPSNSFARKGRFLRRVGRFFPKAARLGSKSPGFSLEGAALLPTSSSFLDTVRGGVQKIPRCLPDSEGISFAARTAGRVARSGFSTWRRWGAIA